MVRFGDRYRDVKVPSPGVGHLWSRKMVILVTVEQLEVTWRIRSWVAYGIPTQNENTHSVSFEIWSICRSNANQNGPKRKDKIWIRIFENGKTKHIYLVDIHRVPLTIEGFRFRRNRCHHFHHSIQDEFLSCISRQFISNGWPSSKSKRCSKYTTFSSSKVDDSFPDDFHCTKNCRQAFRAQAATKAKRFTVTAVCSLSKIAVNSSNGMCCNLKETEITNLVHYDLRKIKKNNHIQDNWMSNACCMLFKCNSPSAKE